MESIYINHLAVIVATVADFMIGGVWYSALFTKPWMKANGFTESDLNKGKPAVIFGVSFLFSLIITYNLAFFLGDANTDWVWGLTAGLLAGVGWAAMGMGIIAMFERRPPAYLLIHAGYLTVSFAMKGFVLGIWR